MNNMAWATDLTVDLHQHSTYSDGVLTPTQLVSRAKTLGITTMALTDHDTVLGVEEMVVAGRDQGIVVIQGIEISVDSAAELHILGYGIDWHNSALQKACQSFADARKQRGRRMVAVLNEQGIGVTEAMVESFAGEGVVVRPHVARALVAMGVVDTMAEAFTQYLDTETFKRKIERQKPNATEAITLIKQSGGVAVLAHPFSTEKVGEALYNYLQELKGYGLAGVEVYHPTHDEAFSAQCADYARQLGLVMTRGSDFHGE